jgi:hypothetical protein
MVVLLDEMTPVFSHGSELHGTEFMGMHPNGDFWTFDLINGFLSTRFLPRMMNP